jgi:hypothetical protein
VLDFSSSSFSFSFSFLFFSCVSLFFFSFSFFKCGFQGTWVESNVTGRWVALVFFDCGYLTFVMDGKKVGRRRWEEEGGKKKVGRRRWEEEGRGGMAWDDNHASTPLSFPPGSPEHGPCCHQDRFIYRTLQLQYRQHYKPPYVVQGRETTWEDSLFPCSCLFFPPFPFHSLPLPCLAFPCLAFPSLPFPSITFPVLSLLFSNPSRYLPLLPQYDVEQQNLPCLLMGFLSSRKGAREFLRQYSPLLVPQSPRCPSQVRPCFASFCLSVPRHS